MFSCRFGTCGAAQSAESTTLGLGSANLGLVRPEGPTARCRTRASQTFLALPGRRSHHSGKPLGPEMTTA